MKTEIVMARAFLKKSGIKNPHLALTFVKAQLRLGKMGAQIFVAGSDLGVPNVEILTALKKGLQLLMEETGHRLPRNNSSVPMPKVRPPKGPRPKKLFYTTAPGSRAQWDLLPGQEQEQCCRCRHVMEPGEEKAQREREPGIFTDLCPRCGCAEFYLFKYEVPHGQA